MDLIRLLDPVLKTTVYTYPHNTILLVRLPSLYY